MTGRQVLVGVPPKDENGKIEFHFNQFSGTISREQHVLGSVVGNSEIKIQKQALILGTKGISF
nr:hypothetical protein [Mycoplasmopsis bovis]